jgi:large subunit ribosomal protein L23
MSIVIRPIITEKASTATERYNRYSFEVAPKANKIEIKNAVESAYGVSVEKVRTIIVRAERRTRHTKTGLQRSKSAVVKKAIVQLAEGETLDLYANL